MIAVRHTGHQVKGTLSGHRFMLVEGVGSSFICALELLPGKYFSHSAD
ncbi:MAG: hypothetical protein JXK93_13105 [Sphaerochaetaceae bacterium]|nr:hypothetical protein [Sphaerochaetaceae bacterium]